MKKSISCLNYRENRRYERQGNKPISWFKREFKFGRRKRHGPVPTFMKCLDAHSNAVSNVIARRYRHLLPHVLELIWMMRVGRKLYKMLGELYSETDNSVTE
jgi:hypothetical protein